MLWQGSPILSLIKRHSHTREYTQRPPVQCTRALISFLPLSAQTLDSSELQGDGIVLSLEEQLNALSLSSSPSPSGPDPKDTVALNGTRFPSHLFVDTSESTKVGCRCTQHPNITKTSRIWECEISAVRSLFTRGRQDQNNKWLAWQDKWPYQSYGFSGFSGFSGYPLQFKKSIYRHDDLWIQVQLFTDEDDGWLYRRWLLSWVVD